ncbi:MAG: hypothetical protein IJN96_03445 [Clostridia bacterium]|nr:hypothetical protein [Clostridia bacterium]
MFYGLIVIAAVLFSLQFFCQQRYEETKGTSMSAALAFSLYKGLVVIAMMLCLNKFRMEFSLFSIGLSGAYALCYILMTYYSLKAFYVANLSVYSVFTMLGGMMLPFLVGTLFYDEEISAFKILCCVLIVISVLLNIRKGNGGKKAFFYYMMVFFLNGMVGVISKVHQNSEIMHTDSTSFMFYSGIFTVVVCSVWLLAKGERLSLLKGKSLLYSAGDGVLNGVGDLLLLIAIAELPASVQYPLVTGGVMVFSTVISMIRREKLVVFEYLAAVIALIASVMMAF